MLLKLIAVIYDKRLLINNVYVYYTDTATDIVHIDCTLNCTICSDTNEECSMNHSNIIKIQKKWFNLNSFKTHYIHF